MEHRCWVLAAFWLATVSSHRMLLQTDVSTLSPVTTACANQLSGDLTVSSGGALNADTSCSYQTEAWNIRGTTYTFTVNAVMDGTVTIDSGGYLIFSNVASPNPLSITGALNWNGNVEVHVTSVAALSSSNVLLQWFEPFPSICPAIGTFSSAVYGCTGCALVIEPSNPLTACYLVMTYASASPSSPSPSASPSSPSPSPSPSPSSSPTSASSSPTSSVSPSSAVSPSAAASPSPNPSPSPSSSAPPTQGSSSNDDLLWLLLLLLLLLLPCLVLAAVIGVQKWRAHRHKKKPAMGPQTAQYAASVMDGPAEPNSQSQLTTTPLKPPPTLPPWDYDEPGFDPVKKPIPHWDFPIPEPDSMLAQKMSSASPSGCKPPPSLVAAPSSLSKFQFSRSDFDPAEKQPVYEPSRRNSDIPLERPVYEDLYDRYTTDHEPRPISRAPAAASSSSQPLDRHHHRHRWPDFTDLHRAGHRAGHAAHHFHHHSSRSHGAAPLRQPTWPGPSSYGQQAPLASHPQLYSSPDLHT